MVNSRAALAGLALALMCACRPVDEQAPRPRVELEPVADHGAPAPARTPATPMVTPDFASVAERLGPSVVAVISTIRSPEPSNGHSRVRRGIGAGMVVSARGQILTNEHVVASATEVDVELSNRDRVSARVIYQDPLLDLALLQLDADVTGLEPVQFRETPARPGEWVMAIGQPFGLGNTVTVGVVGGLGRDHGDLGRPRGLRADGIWSFIQTDASINIGNSGGPLVDPNGHVVGITTAVRVDGQGLAFAIPADMARKFLDEVWTYGRVRHPRLGIRADNVGPDVFPGRMQVVRITAVSPVGPGKDAGLEVGDFVLAVDDQPISRVSEVAYLTQLRGVGSIVDLTIKRGDAPATHVQVVPAESI